MSELEKTKRALADLLADVTSGNIKNGGNPWCMESVKNASEVLTGDRFGFSAGKYDESRRNDY